MPESLFISFTGGLVFGGLAGALLAGIVTGTVAFLWLRTVAQRQRHDRAVNEAVLNTQLETRAREVENLNFRLIETQQRFQQREQQFQQREDQFDVTVVSEATLKTKLEALSSQHTNLEERLASAGTLLDQLRADNAGYREQISHLQTKLTEQERQNGEKLELLEQARERLNTEFKNLANEIFESRNRAFKEQSQSQMDSLLKPLNERIKDFEKRVEDTYSQESRERFSLIQEVKNLQELNARISQDAVNLTNALKGENKTQGNWGEVVLERVLEKSGLEKGREYETQVSLTSEEGRRLRPDVIVHLPEAKDVIIDAKVSLVAYEQFSSEQDDQLRETAVKRHIQSIKQHVKQLSEKNYQSLYDVQTLDFVLLFVPIEAAFITAVQFDNDLFANAFKKNIMLVSPSTLLATLRMIHNIWRFDQQNKNAQEIAEKAGSLYDKFVNFVADLEDIGGRINSVQTAYDKAHNKLVSGKGNLITRAESMRELGAKTSKSLPANLVEMPVRQLGKTS
jgi:DNA recombination protein RmuC